MKVYLLLLPFLACDVSASWFWPNESRELTTPAPVQEKRERQRPRLQNVSWDTGKPGISRERPSRPDDEQHFRQYGSTRDSRNPGMSRERPTRPENEQRFRTRGREHHRGLRDPRDGVEVQSEGSPRVPNTTEFILDIRPTVQPDHSQPRGIPVDIGMALSSAGNLSDFLNLLHPESTLLGEGAGPSMVRSTLLLARNAALIPKPANCMPELKTVEITTSDDPTLLYWPTCTRIERCGGCCTHDLLTCRPTQTEQVTLQVIKSQYVEGTRLTYLGKELVTMEKHVACACGCKVQPEDCSSLQRYRRSECRCVCKNSDDQEKCWSNTNKFWDPSKCQCRCRQEKLCSTGSYFDHNSCMCVRIPSRNLPNRRRRPSDDFTDFPDLYSLVNEVTTSSASAGRPALQPKNARRLPASGRRDRIVRVQGPQRSDRWQDRARRNRG